MHAVKLHQQNPPVLNCRCQMTQVDLYNGCVYNIPHLDDTLNRQ